MTTKTVQKEEEDIDYSKTPNYDKVCQNIRKLLSVTGQTFIQDACAALRRDWYPDLSENQIRNNKEARDKIREHIYNDWCRERNSEGPWAARSILVFFPKWLRNPVAEEGNKVSVAAMNEANRLEKTAKKIAVSDDQKQALVRMVTKLPETVIVHQQPEPYTEGGPIIDEPMLTVQAGTGGKTIMSAYGEITMAYRDLWTALTEKKEMPHLKDDVVNDHIKPTRDYRRSIIMDVDENMRTAMYNDLANVERAIDDMLKIIEKERDT